MSQVRANKFRDKLEVFFQEEGSMSVVLTHLIDRVLDLQGIL